jgi:hypothetical protein
VREQAGELVAPPRVELGQQVGAAGGLDRPERRRGVVRSHGGDDRRRVLHVELRQQPAGRARMGGRHGAGGPLGADSAEDLRRARRRKRRGDLRELRSAQPMDRRARRVERQEMAARGGGVKRVPRDRLRAAPGAEAPQPETPQERPAPTSTPATRSSPAHRSSSTSATRTTLAPATSTIWVSRTSRASRSASGAPSSGCGAAPRRSSTSVVSKAATSDQS